MIGLVLLYVGAVLFVNGIWLLGYADNREIAILNVFAGFVGVVAAVFSVAEGEILAIQAGAFILLFAFTYLWVAFNQFTGADGRGLGWYSLFVAITAVPICIITLAGANGDPFTTWLGINWGAWAVLWFLYFLLLGLQRPIQRLSAWVTLIVGVLTAWVPGFLVLTEYLQI